MIVFDKCYFNFTFNKTNYNLNILFLNKFFITILYVHTCILCFGLLCTILGAICYCTQILCGSVGLEKFQFIVCKFIAAPVGIVRLKATVRGELSTILKYCGLVDYIVQQKVSNIRLFNKK